MPEFDTLAEHIARVFATRMSVTVPSEDTDLFETGVLDSLSFVTLLTHLEEDFGLAVSLDDLEFDNFRSIARIAEFVAARNGAKAVS
jgi:methoxymalonate biosynthesis acyl carrier protein